MCGAPLVTLQHNDNNTTRVVCDVITRGASHLAEVTHLLQGHRALLNAAVGAHHLARVRRLCERGRPGGQQQQCGQQGGRGVTLHQLRHTASLRGWEPAAGHPARLMCARAQCPLPQLAGSSWRAPGGCCLLLLLPAAATHCLRCDHPHAHRHQHTLTHLRALLGEGVDDVVSDKAGGAKHGCDGAGD